MRHWRDEADQATAGTSRWLIGALLAFAFTVALSTLSAGPAAAGERRDAEKGSDSAAQPSTSDDSSRNDGGRLERSTNGTSSSFSVTTGEGDGRRTYSSQDDGDDGSRGSGNDDAGEADTPTVADVPASMETTEPTPATEERRARGRGETSNELLAIPASTPADPGIETADRGVTSEDGPIGTDACPIDGPCFPEDCDPGTYFDGEGCSDCSPTEAGGFSTEACGIDDCPGGEEPSPPDGIFGCQPACDPGDYFDGEVCSPCSPPVVDGFSTEACGPNDCPPDEEPIPPDGVSGCQPACGPGDFFDGEVCSPCTPTAGDGFSTEACGANDCPPDEEPVPPDGVGGCQPVCPDGEFGAWPDCVPCPIPSPGGEVGGDACLPENCPEGEVPAPDGQGCVLDVCPDGQVGTPPNCETPEPTTCPSGQIGIPPICFTPSDDSPSTAPTVLPPGGPTGPTGPTGPAGGVGSPTIVLASVGGPTPIVTLPGAPLTTTPDAGSTTPRTTTTTTPGETAAGPISDDGSPIGFQLLGATGALVLGAFFLFFIWRRKRDDEDEDEDEAYGSA